MTPQQHRDHVDTALAKLEATPGPHGMPSMPSPGTLLVIQAHAQLATAAGTGTHYAAADALLADSDKLDRAGEGHRLATGARALLTATMADR